MRKKGKVYIGTSGWSYKHWMETFYPKEVKSQAFLEFYARLFKTVEINNSFYRLPELQTFNAWRESTPKDFLFSVKASRFITHMKKLNDSSDSLNILLKNASFLEEKLGVILFQLPPRWNFNEERIISFLKQLPTEFRYTFEFRTTSWYNERLYEILNKYNVAFCIYEIDFHLSPIITTADFVYVRLHGPNAKYTGSYSNEGFNVLGRKMQSLE